MKRTPCWWLMLGAILMLVACSTQAAVTDHAPDPTPSPLPSPTPTPDIPMLRQACEGTGIPQALPFQEGASLHPVYFFFSDPDDWDDSLAGRTERQWEESLPSGWVVGSIGEAEILACVDSYIVSLEQCRLVNSTTREVLVVDRKQYGLRIQLVTAQSGDVIAEDTIMGSAPSCPLYLRAPAGLVAFQGNPVRVDQIQTWLAPYATGFYAITPQQLESEEVGSTFLDIVDASLSFIGDGSNLTALLRREREIRDENLSELDVFHWDTATGEALTSYSYGPVESIAISPNNQQLAVGSNNHIALLDFETGGVLYEWETVFPGDYHLLNDDRLEFDSIVYSLDGSRLAGVLSYMSLAENSLASDAALWAVSADDDLELISFVNCALPCRDLIVGSNGEILVVDGDDQSRIVRNLETREILNEFPGPTYYAVSWLSPDRTRVFSQKTRDEFILWDANSGEVISSIRLSYTSMPRDAAAGVFSADGTRLAMTAYKPGFLESGQHALLDVGSGEQIALEEIAEDSVILEFAFSYDNSVLAALASDGTVWLWSADTGELQSTYQTSYDWLDPTPDYTHLAFGPVSSILALNLTLDYSRSVVEIWDTSIDTRLVSLEDFPDSIVDMRFSPDGAYLSVMLKDGSVYLMEIP